MEAIHKRIERNARELITLSLVEGFTEEAMKTIVIAYFDREAKELEKELEEGCQQCAKGVVHKCL